MSQGGQPRRRERRFSDLFYNAITYSGVVLAIVVFVLEGFLFVLDLLSDGTNIYLELVTYLILPGFLLLGLALIPIGYFWKKRRVARGLGAEFRALRIDLALPKHRNGLLVFIVGTSVLVLMSTIGSYRAFHYTESTEFCGTLCHEVMKPEHTAYLNSPHGRVKCVECHIGAGADWYVRSKASGLRQVYRTMLNTFNRPIATPIHNLRPAEETCKQCHWPGKFFSTLDFRRAYFLSEGEPARWNIRLLLNVGGGKEQIAGIHAHMNLAGEMFYAAEDERRLAISWVKAIDINGKETIYTAPGSSFQDAQPPPERLRHMDCIDCHNRPTHQFGAPFRLVNTALAYGRIDPSIPSIKQQAVELLAKRYATSTEAITAIRDALPKYYREEHAEFAERNGEKISQAVEVIVDLFEKNIFPEMKARWDAYPDHIGHMYSPGCFRCHDGEHRSKEGKVITRDCNACHLIVEQGSAGAEERNIGGLEFKHPDGSDDWKDTACTECHTGGADF